MPFISVMQSWISASLLQSNMMICCSIIIIIIIDNKLLIINVECLSVLKYHNAFFQDYLNK